MIRPAADWGFTHPYPSHSPEEVVRLQVAALRDDSRTEEHRGSAACFEFASPENQAQTGPIASFGWCKTPVTHLILLADSIAFGLMRKPAILSFPMVVVRHRRGGGL